MMKHSSATAGSYSFIDLFAGAGGLSEGFIQAGFSPVAHVEMNAFAAQTLETRTGYYCLKEKRTARCLSQLHPKGKKSPAMSF